MWTPQNRKRYDRSWLRYPSDLTDEEWAHVAPLIPPAKPGGNKRTVDVREVMNGVMYVLSTGCQWRALPKDLPPSAASGPGRATTPAQRVRSIGTLTLSWDLHPQPTGSQNCERPSLRGQPRGPPAYLLEDPMLRPDRVLIRAHRGLALARQRQIDLGQCAAFPAQREMGRGLVALDRSGSRAAPFCRAAWSWPPSRPSRDPSQARRYGFRMGHSDDPRQRPAPRNQTQLRGP
jgi:transposase